MVGIQSRGGTCFHLHLIGAKDPLHFSLDGPNSRELGREEPPSGNTFQPLPENPRVYPEGIVLPDAKQDIVVGLMLGYGDVYG